MADLQSTTSAASSGLSQFTAGFGGLFQNIFTFIGNNFFTIVFVAFAGALIYYFMWRFILNDTRVIITKLNGLTTVAPARLFFDKKLQTKRIEVVGFKLHDGQAPSEEGFFFYKGAFKLYRGYTAIQDDQGVLHFTAKGIRDGDKQYFNVVSPTKLEQYFASRERAWRKFKLKDEQQARMILVSLIIYTLIMSASLAWGYFQQRKASEHYDGAATSLASAVATQNDLLKKYGVSPPPHQSSQGDTTVVTTPFNSGAAG